MDYKKILGIIFILLGILFAVYPVHSSQAVSWIAGLCLIAFGFASIIDGFSVWSRMAHVSIIKILLGIFAILFGLLFIYEINALSFLIGYLFYLVAFIMIFFGILGLIFGSKISKIVSLLILILGIIAIYLAAVSIANPLYTAIIVGICLIMEGITLVITDVVENN